MVLRWFLGLGIVAVGITLWWVCSLESVEEIAAHASRPIPSAPNSARVTRWMDEVRFKLRSAEKSFAQPESVEAPAKKAFSRMESLPFHLGECPIDGGSVHCVRCTVDSDCPPGTSCGTDDVTGGLSCLSQGCDADADCEGTLACRDVSLPGVTRLVKQCRNGDLQLGAKCGKASLGCARGLNCGPEGRCAKECASESMCSHGEACVKSSRGSDVCEKVCHIDADCPKSMSCISFQEFGSYCTATIGENCLTKPCTKGQACQMYNMGPKTVAFECAQVCNSMDPGSCGPNAVCGQSSSFDAPSTCYRACKTPFDCSDGGVGYACSTVDESFELLGCVPVVQKSIYYHTDGGIMTKAELRALGIKSP